MILVVEGIRSVWVAKVVVLNGLVGILIEVILRVRVLILEAWGSVVDFLKLRSGLIEARGSVELRVSLDLKTASHGRSVSGG